MQDIMRESGITNAHIVDDAFDVAPGAVLRPESIQYLMDHIEEDQFDILGSLLGVENVNDENIRSCLGTIEGTTLLYENRDKFAFAIGDSFEEFTSGIAPENNRVKPLIDYLEEVGIVCHKFGREYEPAGLPEPQMLFVDLKLNERVILLDEPINVVKKFKREYPDRHPLVFLMSSQNYVLKGNQEQFRDRTDLLSSQYEILYKHTFKERSSLKLFLKHHVAAYQKMLKLQDHIAGWRIALDTAKEKMLKTLQCMDFADYFVLHHNTVTLEQVPLGTYVADILLEYMAYLIESSPDLWAFAKDLDLWELNQITRSRFNVKPVVGDIFSGNVLHAFSRIEAERDRGRGISNCFLNLGDVFFDSVEIKNNKISTACVVLSPSCDLVRPSVMAQKKGAVLLCEGEVTELKQSSVLDELDGLHPIVISYPDNGGKQYLVQWHRKRIRTWGAEDIGLFSDPAKEKWVLVGRLRPLYALQLQRVVTADLSRVGVQRPPDVYSPHGVVVLLCVGGKWVEYIKDYKEDPSAAAYSNNKSAHKMTFVISDVVIRETLLKLRRWIKSNDTAPTADVLRAVIDMDEIDTALMWHVHTLHNSSCKKHKATSEENYDDILPLRKCMPEGTSEEILESVVFARQGRDEDNQYGGGKERSPKSRGIVVFKLLNI